MKELIERLRRNPRGAVFELEHQVADALEAQAARIRELEAIIAEAEKQEDDTDMQRPPIERVRCPTCNKRVKAVGLADHMRDAHKEKPC